LLFGPFHFLLFPLLFPFSFPAFPFWLGLLSSGLGLGFAEWSCLRRCFFLPLAIYPTQDISQDLPPFPPSSYLVLPFLYLPMSFLSSSRSPFPSFFRVLSTGLVLGLGLTKRVLHTSYLFHTSPFSATQDTGRQTSACPGQLQERGADERGYSTYQNRYVRESQGFVFCCISSQLATGRGNKHTSCPL